MKFVVFAPRARTGGPFALYQLHDAIKRQGYASEIAFYDSAKFVWNGLECTVKYKTDFYAPKLANIDPDVCFRFGPEDVLIFPEVKVSLMSKFQGFGFQNVVFWWLSWNNAPVQNIDRLDIALSLSKAKHLFQSEFARLNAKEFGFEGMNLSDYTLNHNTAANMATEKTYDLCYFAKKADGAEQVLHKLAQRFRIKKIEKMKENEVADILKVTKFFLDFGIAPGKDRIPREAVLHGCVPIVRRVGAAKNDIDVPLPAYLKPTTSSMLDETYLIELIHSLEKNYAGALEDLEDYRKVILQEQDTFMDEVQNFVCAC